MKKEKKIKINYITYINKHYIPSTHYKKMDFSKPIERHPISGKYNFCWRPKNENT